jgi:hypothetical protein
VFKGAFRGAFMGAPGWCAHGDLTDPPLLPTLPPPSHSFSSFSSFSSFRAVGPVGPRVGCPASPRFPGGRPATGSPPSAAPARTGLRARHGGCPKNGGSDETALSLICEEGHADVGIRYGVSRTGSVYVVMALAVEGARHVLDALDVLRISGGDGGNAGD